MTDHETGHWRGVGGAAVLLGGAAVLFRVPGLALAAVVAVAFAGYASGVGPVEAGGDDAGLTIRRRLSDRTPAPGDEVRVTVEVRNEGDGALPDVRVVDGVPADLAVADGSPRHAASLRPGGATTFTYAVRAVRGAHDWRPAAVTVAGPSGAVERETTVETATSLECALPAAGAPAVPVRALTARRPGRVATDSAGAGVEFHSTREYQPGDPIDRIDWRRRAKTGDLGTVDFRRERAATVVLVVDARAAAYVAPEAGAAHAVERSVAAANRVFGALLDAGDSVGIAAIGRAGEDCWLAPGVGEDHRARGRALLRTHPVLSPRPPEKARYDSFKADRAAELRRRRIDRIRERLPPNTQIMFFSPVCDDRAAAIVRRFDAAGAPVTVLSPDPTTDREPHFELAAMERADRLDALRREGIRVLDWDDSLTAALARAAARWSA